MSLVVVTHDGSLPCNRGGTGRRVGYFSPESRMYFPLTGGSVYIPIPPPPPKPPNYFELPRTTWRDRCIECNGHTSWKRKKLEGGVREVKVCEECGKLMRPY